MTLDQLIFKLENIRREAGTGNLRVLFRDPCDGNLEVPMPVLSEVDSVDNLELFDAFDLSIGDFYVEI